MLQLSVQNRVSVARLNSQGDFWKRTPNRLQFVSMQNRASMLGRVTADDWRGPRLLCVVLAKMAETRSPLGL